MNEIIEKIQFNLLMIVNPQFEIIDFFKLVLISVLFFLTGYLFTRLLMRNGLRLNFLEMIGTSYLLGFSIIPFITLIYSLLSVELQWLSLFMPIIIIDVMLFSFSFPNDISLIKLRASLYDFKIKVTEKKDVLFFFLFIYTIVFSLVLFPLFRGSYLGLFGDAGRYATAAEYILNGKSPFSTELIYFDVSSSNVTSGSLYNMSYTLFYLLTLVSLAVLSGVGSAKRVSYLFGPVFSISGLPLTTYTLLNQFRKTNSFDRSLVKLGVFLVVFVSEEIVFWSFFGKGSIVAISYIFMSLNFFVKLLQERGKDLQSTKKIDKKQFEIILSGFFAGIASLYHITAFIFVIIIAFFLFIEFVVVRKEIKKILVSLGIFFLISIAITLIYWIPFLIRSHIDNSQLVSPNVSLYQTDQQNSSVDKFNSLFVTADIIQRILYPFLVHYFPIVYPPLAHNYLFFGYGTAVLFVISLLSVFRNKTWMKSIEKRLLVSSFIVTYLVPLHPIVTRTFYFAPNRFVIFLELFSSLLFFTSFNKELINHDNAFPFRKKLINRYYIILTISWLIILFFTLRWYAYALFFF